MTRYLTLAEYFWLAEQVTGTQGGVLVKAARVELADSALHAPAAGFGDQDFYPDVVDEAGSRSGSASAFSSHDLSLTHASPGELRLCRASLLGGAPVVAVTPGADRGPVADAAPLCNAPRAS